MRWGLLAVAASLAALALAPGALADGWLPHPAGATWTYSFGDNVYVSPPVQEKVTVGKQKGASFALHWTTDGIGNPDGSLDSTGDVQFQETPGGIINTDWSSSPPPPGLPVLCASLSGCNNSLSSTWYYLIWGSRSPLLAEPLLAGKEWSGTGGGNNDVTSDSRYAGTERITVPAFPSPVDAAKVVSTVTQVGALGDPYGSGTRTVWWVYGVGPVKMTFQHAGGAGAPLTTSVLQSTSLKAQPLPPDVDWFPLVKGTAVTYRWTNTKWLKKPEVEKLTIDDAAASSARFTAKSVSGPLKMAGSYGFSTRLSGVTNLWGDSEAATKLTFPPLGPSSLPASKRRHFFGPFDLMTFGFNPLLPAYPQVGVHWRSSTKTEDWTNFGVSGTTKIVGIQKVTVPAGTFRALEVRSTLTQRGFPYGSGTRTCWFASGAGLVKLVFKHRDGSVSTVVLTHLSH